MIPNPFNIHYVLAKAFSLKGGGGVGGVFQREHIVGTPIDKHMLVSSVI